MLAGVGYDAVTAGVWQTQLEMAITEGLNSMLAGNSSRAYRTKPSKTAV